MIIFNEKDEIVENPDLSLGYLDDESIDVTCTWTVDIPEVSHRETIAIYENGGRSLIRPKKGIVKFGIRIMKSLSISTVSSPMTRRRRCHTIRHGRISVIFSIRRSS